MFPKCREGSLLFSKEVKDISGTVPAGAALLARIHCENKKAAPALVLLAAKPATDVQPATVRELVRFSTGETLGGAGHFALVQAYQLDFGPDASVCLNHHFNARSLRSTSQGPSHHRRTELYRAIGPYFSSGHESMQQAFRDRT